MPRVVGEKVWKDSDGNDVYAPIVVITAEMAVPTGRCVATVKAMIDSGADSTVIPFDFLAGCRLDWSALASAGAGTGAGGLFDLRWLDARVKYREWIVTERVKVAEPGKLPMALLGRTDFLAKFNVRFRWDLDPPVVDVDPLAKRR